MANKMMGGGQGRQKAVWHQQENLSPRLRERLAKGCDECGAVGWPVLSYGMGDIRKQSLDGDLVLCPKCAGQLAELMKEQADTLTT